ncbi:MAG: SurA N-terminal domain-containing protein [Candidatus Aquicultorales bacterium]
MRAFKYGVSAAIALLLSVTVLVSGCGGGEKLAASVNGTGIPMSKLDNYVKQFEKMQAAQLKGKNKDEVIKKYKQQIIDQLIDQELVIQEAERQKITVTDKEIDKKYEEIRKSANKSEKEAEKILADQGMTVAEFKENLKAQLIAQRFYTKLTSGIKMSDADIKKFYDERKDIDFKVSANVKVQEIFAATEDKAKQAKADLDGGADFGETAKTYSEDEAKDQESVKTQEAVDPEWSKVVFTQSAGAVTDVFKTSRGFHIVKVIEKNDAKIRPFEEVKDIIKQQQIDKKKDDAFLKWLSGLKKKSKIEKFI